MAVSDKGGASTSSTSTEAPNLTDMFKSVLSEMKELKQTVATLVEPVYDYDEQGDKHEESDEGTTTGGKEPAAAGETSKSPAAKASGSKLLAKIVQELDINEKMGSDVDKGFVKLMGRLLQDKLQEDKVQTRVEKYPRPGNFEGLRKPRVNPLIWNQIPAQVHTSDSKSQKSQNALVASVVAMIKATNLLIEQEDEATAKDKEVVSTLTDAMQCFHDMNSSRRQAMKKTYIATIRPSVILPQSLLRQSTCLGIHPN